MKHWVIITLLLSCCGLIFAQNGLSMADRKAIAMRIKKDTLPYTVERLPEQINSPFSEFNPLLLSDSLFFYSSMRSEVDDDNESFFDTHWSNRIYQADYENNGYQNIRALSSVINKGKYYHPNFCFNKAMDYMVFSRCYRTVNEELMCDLYESHKQKGKWGKAQLLGSGINGVGFSSTQPFLAELEDYAVLYFVSNRSNGQGDMDIWFSIYKNGKYETPVNLGSGVNTVGNEVTPFYDVANGTLYFSSDEWPGIGGYDIFSSKGGLCSWTTPVNMGFPLNSEENDIYFSVNHQGNSGYFSSNRLYDAARLEDTCCNDIYRWENLIKERDIIETSQDSVPMVIKELFPLNLYFDNDQPDPKTLTDTTIERYLALQEDYSRQKEQYVLHAADAGERQWMESFFEDSLANSQEKLRQLLSFVEERLARGQQIILSIEGYASVLHSSDYNRHLSLRRIVSLLNELKAYKDGVLCVPIQQGLLKIIELPYGSSKAEVLKDHAVYSKTAILQRKVIIWDIETGR